ncbi:MBL fold metallo-hydrolase [Oceanicella sp. SM1341]|uniref:MBL fold metallo-hydrolase n=1 Tax=Oceanicella sp. SM1341 TaxID=1548889 RepID=UPI000E4D1A13|nr:MBL fold metallo-hydrolase [Oceanicella sp. SM1341]
MTETITPHRPRLAAPAVSRRAALALAAAGAAGAGLAPGLRPASAAVPTQGGARPGWYRFSLGGMEVTTLLDGLRIGEGPHPTFGADQEAGTVASLLEENFLPTDRFANGFTPVLVNTGSSLVLFDTGLGAGARGNGMGKLTDRLSAAGVNPDDIDTVVITHMHGDHIGGLMEDGAPAFANASYVMGQAEYDFWTADAQKTGPTERGAAGVAANVVPLAEKTTFIAPGDSVAPGIEAMEAFGHTPGHLVFHLESEGARLMLTADTVNHYVVSMQRPDWEVAYDMDKAAAAATRRKVLGMIAEERIPFAGYHMPFPALGYLEARDEGFRFVPASYQFDV